MTWQSRRNKVWTFVFMLILMSCFCVSSSLARTYYVSSSSGSDYNDGTSPSYPWKSISKVNNSMGSFSPGDTIKFKRGDTWTLGGAEATRLAITVSGTSDTARVVVGAYGTGNKPKFDGNNASNWQGMIYMNGQSFITIENLEAYNGWKGIIGINDTSSDPGIAEGIIIQDCELHTSASGYMIITVRNWTAEGRTTDITIRRNKIHDSGWNGIKICGGCTYVTIDSNEFYNIPHAGIDTLLGITPPARNSNLTITNNHIYNVHSGIYIVNTENSTIDGNNIHTNIGTGWGVKVEVQNGSCSGITIQRNVIRDFIYDSSSSGLQIANGAGYIDIYNNTLYDNYTAYTGWNNGSWVSFANNLPYANTVNGALPNYGQDPKVVNPTGSPPDLHLQSDSPAIDQGIDVGLPYNGVAPDLGAYEYIPDGERPDPPTGLMILSSP